MKTILLIEDNSDIREGACELLEMEGYHVVPAINGISGLLLAKQFLPDLVLCDIIMPDINGYEVFKKLKANTSTEFIPFIFLTANVEKNEVAAGLEMGAEGYIRKPFGPEELFETISLVLRRTSNYL
jgi:DNA-binding response OmpR family regulator